MSNYWDITEINKLPLDIRSDGRVRKIFVERRIRAIAQLKSHFDAITLAYLDEKIIDYIVDSLHLTETKISTYREVFHDFSFLTAPAYKAFEGYLFQIARDLALPSAKPDFVGTFFDEEKIDRAVNKILK